MFITVEGVLQNTCTIKQPRSPDPKKTFTISMVHHTVYVITIMPLY
jgi:hypothetical protein